MLFQYLLPALLAATAVASPIVADIPNVDEAVGEMILFKRDDVLEPRDLELAKRHGVDLNDMYRHAMIKRDDGDHITIWVANDFLEHQNEDEDENDLVKRQRAKPVGGYRSGGTDDYCWAHKRQNHTGPNGPTSGGVQAMYKWANSHRGSWEVRSPGWKNLVIAGSNGGTNARYRAHLKLSRLPYTRIGTKDVRNDADWTQNRARKFGTQWRASSKGGETCQSPSHRVLYEIVKTDINV